MIFGPFVEVAIIATLSDNDSWLIVGHIDDGNRDSFTSDIV